MKQTQGLQKTGSLYRAVLKRSRIGASVVTVASAFALSTGLAAAQDLQNTYRLALKHDATYQSALSVAQSTAARAEQAKAGLYPTANLAANASRTNQEVNTPASDRYYGTRSATLSASVPLYRPANWASYKQGQAQEKLAALQVKSAEQDLIIRVSQAYFDVLASQDSLAFVKAQKTAVAEQLASAKRNFEVGTSTITDSREAQARFDLVLAQEIAAENDLRSKQLVLNELAGQAVKPQGLAAKVALPLPQPQDAEAWVNQAQNQHPNVAQAQTALDVAKLESNKAAAGHQPTLDLTSNLTRVLNNGSSSSIARNGVSSAAAGLSLNIPLFSGFATNARITEAAALESKAASDLANAKRSVGQATRLAFLGVQSGLGQVKALEAAEASSQSALDANKLGYQVGVRINIDVLNSQSQLFQTKRDLAKARYDVLLGTLKLRQANGSLSEPHLEAVNGLLAKP